MSVNISTAQANEILDALDATYNNGVIEIRSGAKPAGANNVPSGTLLATIALPADAFAPAANRSKAKAGSWPAAVYVASGTAGHFRMKTSTDTGASSTTERRIDADVTATGGGGNLELSDTAIDATKTITVNSFTLTLP